MAENIQFTVCVQSLDDFNPIPSLQSRKDMMEKAIEEFRKFLEDKDRQGSIIIGFRVNQT
jgi:hypothetical protein